MSDIIKKNILITGGTGYLGSNIINALNDKHNFILLKRRSSNLVRIAGIIDKVRICDIEDLNQNFLEKLNVDIILHCATHYGRKDIDAVNTIEANLMLPLKLISYFQQANKVIKFINTDTILDKHINVYTLSKSQFKDWMKFFAQKNFFINIQLEHFYGPLDDNTKFVSYLIDSFVKEVPHIDLTKGEQNRYFTYIDDVVSAFDIIINNSENFDYGFTEFQVSSDEPVNLKEFVNLVKKLSLNKYTKLNFGVIPYRSGELFDFTVDTTAIKRLGWVPKVNLEDGLKQTINVDKQKV